MWKELIVNAIAHRDYSIKGTDIQIKMFDDHMVVESPGILPGIVRLNNMRVVHFSRNPKIAEFLHDYDYVQEFGEGVDRMYREMEAAGLPMPEYVSNAFMLNATIRNGELNHENERITKMSELLKGKKSEIIRLLLIYLSSHDVISTKIGCELTGKSSPQVRRYLNMLVDAGVLIESNSTKNKTYTVNPKLKQSNNNSILMIARIISDEYL